MNCINYLSTRCDGRTVKYKARGFEVRTELARSVRKNEGLVLHGTAQAIRFSVDSQIFRKLFENSSRILRKIIAPKFYQKLFPEFYNFQKFPESLRQFC